MLIFARFCRPPESNEASREENPICGPLVGFFFSFQWFKLKTE